MVSSFTAKIIKIGNSLGVIIPKRVIKNEKLKVGDEVWISIKKANSSF